MLAAEQTYSQEVLLLWKQLVVCQCPQCVFCCLCTTCDLSKDPHTYTYIHTAGRHTQVPTIQTENSAPLHMTPSLSISDFVIHSYTHTRTYKENNQMLVPPQQPTPLHQQLLPQQQVSRHPPPAVFCQRWNTGVFKPWTQAKHAHTHTCRVIKKARPAAVMAEDIAVGVFMRVSSLLCRQAQHSLNEWVKTGLKKLDLCTQHVTANRRVLESVRCRHKICVSM